MFSKKASGEAVSAMIMFIAIVAITTGLVVSFKNYVSETQSSLDFQNDITKNKLKSSMAISHISYNISSETIFIYVKNVGETKMQPQDFDVFIDDSFENGFSHLYANNLSKTMTLFNPQDTLAIVHNITLVEGTHDVRIVSEYGVSVEDSFNI